MPEISLKDYYAKLNSLLSSSAADEVIHHSRHILKYYPKNVTATRFLGRGLVLNGRWEEGRDALRRVLSVVPDDYPAHLALSEANERMNRPDEAIWHLERAFEQRPNDKDLIDALRGLYRRYRQIDNLKIQLTSAAVARQYLRSGAYTQAIDALRGALTRLNDRLDLKLLLAQTLWQQGSKEEAAEIALEVLKILPDCLEANRIMALLWLESGRPSDAQRYVSHLEGVDPYLAVELAQGAPPEDDAFRLDELDYARSAQAEMTSARPDWLREISAAPAPVEEPAQQQPASELSDWASAMLGTQKPPQAVRPPAEKATTSARFAAMKGDEPPSGLTDVFGKPEEANTAELNALFDAQAVDDAEDPMAWLKDTGVQLVEEDDDPAFSNLFDEDDGPLPDTDQDPMAWLKNTDEGAVLETDGAAADDPYAWANSGAGQKNGAANGDDSLDWLRGSDLLDEALDLDDISEGSPADLATQKMQIPGAKKSEAETPADAGVPGPRRGLTAILQESNFEWVNKQDEVVSDDEMDDWLNQFGVTEPRKAAGEAPDWLNDLEQPEMSRLEADEWFKPDETAVPETPVALPDELIVMSSDDNEDSDWLAEFAPQEESQPTPDDEFAWQTPEATPAAPAPAPAPAEAEPASEIPDWISSLEPEDEEGDEFEDAGDEEPAAEDEFAWMTDDVLSNAEGTSSEALDWFAELEPEAVSTGDAETPASADSGLAWTSDRLEPDAEPISEGVPDWLADLQNQPAVSDVSADETKLDPDFSWNASTPAEPEAVAEEQPDWLADLAPDGVAAEAQPPVSDADFSWMTVDETPSEPTAAAISDTDFSWMSDEATDEGEAEAEPGGVPDWLSDLQPSAASTPVTDAAAADTDFTWLTEDEPADAEPAKVSETPDWLSALQPTAASEPVVEAVSETEFAWLSEEDAPNEDEVEPAEVGETPDWLSELQLDAEPEPEVSVAAVSDTDFGWLSEDEAEADVEVEAEPAEMGETPDWLTALQPAAEPEAPAAAISDTDFAWMSEEEPAEEAEVEPAEMGETPDWLSELQPADEAEPEEPAAEPVVSADFAWMSEEDAPNEDEVEPAEMGETPDWLTALQPVASESAATSLVGDEFKWLTDEDEPVEAEVDLDAEPEAVAEDSDWLSDLGLPSETGAGEPERVEAEIMWTSDESQSPAADLEPASAEELDWLNELAPEAASEDKEFATEESAADEFDWVNEVENAADEDEVFEEAAPVMAVAAPGGDDDELFDDELASEDDEDEVLEPTPAQNAPDWLNAMVPGLDVDYEPGDTAEMEEAEEPAAESATGEFAWLTEMVDEETDVTSRPRFVFSRPPVWLQPTNGAAHAEVVDDDLPDWPSDDADADVPEWLR